VADKAIQEAQARRQVVWEQPLRPVHSKGNKLTKKPDLWSKQLNSEKLILTLAASGTFLNLILILCELH
jgi:hypothetical protein